MSDAIENKFYENNYGENGMDQEKQKKTEKIAAEILQMSKNKLLVNMRFMDMSLNQFKVFPKPDVTPFTASDGKIYIYAPDHILKAYMRSEERRVGKECRL